MTAWQQRTWEQLPGPVQEAVQRYTGPLTSRDPVPATGTRSVVVLHLDGAASGPVILKAAPCEEDGGAAIAREQTIHVAHEHALPAPALRWRSQVANWRVSLFTHVPGRLAMLAPGGEDVMRVLNSQIFDLRVAVCREAVRRAEVALSPVRDDCLTLVDAAGDLDAGERDLLRRALLDFDVNTVEGEVIVHGDLTSRHILIAQDAEAGNPVTLVDWSGGMYGDPCVDITGFGLHLGERGHAPDYVEMLLLDRLPAWKAAPLATVDGLIAMRALTVTAPASPGCLFTPLEAGLAWLRYRHRLD
ncbi:unnamed protein product [[Actinomadura] parvosata subsp. kistnae]|uniref:Aminoglycoside phosphotransferase domain-containing protein n=1 Tax=[Actinomadura] parvosata subsp. kistnae TaxID=1909395 RepID=A0A1U9ZYI7_9ACTN|nr:phosphotransferase [Nonomuraea sp. ATCC 55076]AQZ63018.1 hypothetical protein BKM31_17510 [Nonomuraea sp. ATCC 55076]SPL99959.1 unnamed protein product [Actinomadura parvosata subsp. kistnae]